MLGGSPWEGGGYLDCSAWLNRSKDCCLNGNDYATPLFIPTRRCAYCLSTPVSDRFQRRSLTVFNTGLSEFYQTGLNSVDAAIVVFRPDLSFAVPATVKSVVPPAAATAAALASSRLELRFYDPNTSQWTLPASDVGKEVRAAAEDNVVVRASTSHLSQWAV